MAANVPDAPNDRRLLYLHLLAARQAEATLMRGFYQRVRDCGGPVVRLSARIDEGVMIGTRASIFGAFISQTCKP